MFPGLPARTETETGGNDMIDGEFLFSWAARTIFSLAVVALLVGAFGGPVDAYSILIYVGAAVVMSFFFAAFECR